MRFMRDTSVMLVDGRSLAYTDLGSLNSPLVMYFHGAPTSRLDLAPLEGALSDLDVRVVSPDRPGYGGSSPQPGRGIDDWPLDVAALADRLDVRRFAVMGWSSGGPYALVCAASLANRVSAAGVVAGVTDMAWPAAWDGFEESEASLMRVGDEAGAVAWCEERYGPDGGRFLDGDSGGDLAPADTAALEDEVIAGALVATVGEGFRQGVGGYAEDITLQGRAWPFDPATVTAHVRVLHGQADTYVPLAHGRHTAEVIAGAELTTWPDHGHISIFIAEVTQLAADLVAQMR